MTCYITTGRLISLVGLINSTLYQIASLLGSHPDLKEHCEDFIAYVEKTGDQQLMLSICFI